MQTRLNEYKFRLATDPMLIFAQDILSPDKYGINIPVPECLQMFQRLDPTELVGITKSISENWVNALRPVRPAGSALTPKNQMYRRAFQYFLNFLEEISDDYSFSKFSHDKFKDWLYRWIHLMTCPLRWIDMDHYKVRSEIRRKENPTQEEINLFNDNGLYQWYGAYKNFIIYHNPKVWDFIESFRIKSMEVPNLSFVTHLKDGVCKIDRVGELKNDFNYPQSSFIDFRGLWSESQTHVFATTNRENLNVFFQDFIPPICLTEMEYESDESNEVDILTMTE